MKLLFISVLVGASAGLLGALCGIGGGIVMVPAFSAMGLGYKNAVATSLAVIVITAIVATLNNARTENLIDWKIVALTAIGAAAASWWGTDLMHQLRSPTLTKIFAVTLIVFGVKMLFTKA